jgi:hypothetical protein
MPFQSIRFLTIVFTIAIFCSCKKEIPDCSRNCTDLNFAGFVFDKSTNVPLPNRNVNIVLRQLSNCIVCSSKTIASGKSNSNGYFSITATFDTSLLREYYLDVQATAPDNFINNAQPVGPGVSNTLDNTSSKQFTTIDTATFKNLRFDFYPRVLLKINLRRTSTTVQQYPFLSQSYTFDDRTSVWGLRERETNQDTTLTIYTSANIFTKIISRKQSSPTNITTGVDSIRCLSNIINTIDITY